ncbi:MAG: NfeD family protein [Candidatus Thorarchaeota archaeon]|nr:NfeD family protein [Candidatus Thorarchaeota archaeon]
MVSARIKFIIITLDELALVPIAVLLAHFFAPEYTVLVAVVGIIIAAIFVPIKYYLVYPTLKQTESQQIYNLVGMTAVVISTVTSKSGKVRLGSEIWDALCDEGTDFPTGSKVRIVSRESLKVHVGPTEDVPVSTEPHS